MRSLTVAHLSPHLVRCCPTYGYRYKLLSHLLCGLLCQAWQLLVAGLGRARHKPIYLDPANPKQGEPFADQAIQTLPFRWSFKPLPGGSHGNHPLKEKTQGEHFWLGPNARLIPWPTQVPNRSHAFPWFSLVSPRSKRLLLNMEPLSGRNAVHVLRPRASKGRPARSRSVCCRLLGSSWQSAKL